MIPPRFGRYRVLEQIGAGGMGIVYRAHDERLDRDVAIKVLPSGALHDDKARRRFHKEATTLSRLAHPNIEVVHDFDNQDGMEFLVTELIRGISVAEKLRSGALPVTDVAHLGIQIGRGLQAAHKAGVVHCDLKPANLLVDGAGHLKIIDFGLASLSRPAEAMAATATNTSVDSTTSGTLPYMAPEQLRAGAVDPRTDIYGLGVVLYEMATGRLPFAQAHGPMLIEAILHEAPVPPSNINPKISPGLENIILKALDKDPNHRYHSVTELLVDLERLTTPTSVLLPERARPYQWLRMRRVWGSVALILASVAVAMWFGTRPVLSFAPRNWLLVTEFDNQTGDAVLDQSLLTALTVSLEQSRRANIFPHSRVGDTLRRMGKPPTSRVDESLGREICLRENIRGLVTGSVSKVGSRYLIAARLVDPNTGNAVRSYMESAKDQDHVLDALGAISRDIRHDLGESMGALRGNDRPLPEVTTPSLQALKLYADGSARWKAGKWDEAVGSFQQALKIDPDFAMAHAALGVAWSSHIYNNAANGIQELKKALALSNRTTDRESMSIQATYAGNLGHYDEAARAYRAYLDAYPDDAGMRYNFASQLRNQGQYADAVAEFKQAIRIAPSDASAWINLATTYSLMGNVAESLHAYTEAFHIEPGWVTLGNLNHEYGFTLLEAGQEAKALEVFRQALALPNMKAQAQRSLALLDIYHGRYHLAADKLRDAMALNRAANAPLSEARNHLFMTFVASAQGRRSETLRELDLAAKALHAAGDQPNFACRIAVEYARNGNMGRANEISASVGANIDLHNADEATEYHRLRGELQLARQEYDQAIQTLALADHEARNTLSRVSLARAYTAAGDIDHAITTWELIVSAPQMSLNWEPLQSWLEGHYELAKLYQARNRRADAARVLDELLALWSHADSNLPLLKQARDMRKTL